MLIRKLLRTAWRYKAQFLSMIIMVAIGVGVWVGFNMEWKTIEADTAGFFEATNFADFRLYQPGGFSEEDIEKIRQIDGVQEATRYLQINVDVPDTNKSLALSVSEDYNVSTMYLMEGEEYDPSSDGIWLSDQYAAENDIAIGDTLTMTYQGLTIEGEVAGLIKSGEMLICVSGDDQLMPDYSTFGFCFITPEKLKKVLGADFYPQINLISDMDKESMEEAVRDALGRTTQVVEKELIGSYAESRGEMEEGKTMAAILPVLFLVIAMLTMITTMSRIAVNEKVQIGTLKALGFKDRRITRHYTVYGLLIGLLGTVLGIGLGVWICWFIMNPDGSMGTYFDMPDWSLHVPGFIWPYLAVMLVLLTAISYLSVKRMLKGTAADALRPYVPQNIRRTSLEKLKLWDRLPFGIKWNMRDILRHKARSAMTLLGVVGCMLLLVGGFGMKDTMDEYLRIVDQKVNLYRTRITLAEGTSREDAEALMKDVEGDFEATSGISYNGKTIAMNVYHIENGLYGFVDEDNRSVTLSDDGVYLCLRLKDTAKIGDTITISPYGSEEEYEVKVAGYVRSVMTEGIMMTDAYAEKAGIPYQVTAVFTNRRTEEIESSKVISGTQDFQAIMDSFDSFTEVMNTMIYLLVAAAVLLGIVVLYNLGVMSYVERYTELATLKVLGFRNIHIARLLINQNVWLTLLGVILGLPGGWLVLKYLISALASEYELMLYISPSTALISTGLTMGVSLLVSWMVARKNRKIDMVAALKGTE